jgi:hypothetical protein
MSPHEVKFALDMKLMKLGSHITGIHSIVVEGDTVHVGYDLAPTGEVLFFEYQKPELVARDEIHDFSLWLAMEYTGMSVH